MSVMKFKESNGDVKLESYKVGDMDGKPEGIYIDMERSVGRKTYTLTWHNLSATVDMKHQRNCMDSIKSKFCCDSSDKLAKNKLIINEVSGIARPGELLAVMGASGAGKTTLLRALTQRNKGGLKLTGEIRLNGKLIKLNSVSSASQLSKISGYVEQDDIFIGSLTVKEHLKFQAMLKLPRTYTYEEKMERVEQVLLDLNLKKCENNLIGMPQWNIPGISGGERRRLGFATESITNPYLLFCDEPTSGLDSFMAQSIVETMRNIAKQGKTIICTIHQPSSETFEMFDNLYLMSEGRVAYAGPLSMSTEFFKKQGYKCPKKYNPADYFIKQLAILPTQKEECLEKVTTICNAFQASSYQQDIVDEINANNKLSSSTEDFKMTFSTDNYVNNAWTQLRWLVWRNFVSQFRNPQETRVHILQTIVVALIYGLTYMNSKLDQDGVQSLNGAIFFIVANQSFVNCNTVITNFPAEMPIFYREYTSKMYRVATYYLSKMISEFPRFVFVPILFCLIGYWLSGLTHTFVAFAIASLVAVIISNISAAYGSFMAIAMPSISVAFIVSQPMLVFLMVYGGFYLNVNSIAEYLVWIKYISWLYYSNEIMTINQWQYIDKIECSANSTICYSNGDEVLNSLNLKKGNFNMDFLWLVVIYFVLRVMAFVSLLIRAKSRR